jgi:hypothetical protein
MQGLTDPALFDTNQDLCSEFGDEQPEVESNKEGRFGFRGDVCSGIVVPRPHYL